MAKKATLIFLFFSILIGNGFSQATVEDIFEDDTKTVWLGLDFTKFKITGEDVEPEELKEYFVKWNSLILREREEKYHLSDFFDKDDIDTRIDLALKQIDKIDAKSRISEGYGEIHRLDKKDVEEVASNYKVPDSDASLGVIFVMEQFNKGMAKGSMWVTFVNLENGQVLLTDRVEAAPGGIGFRNYWARTYFNVMVEVEDELMDEWEDEL